MSHTVLIADDHTLVRAGLRALLEGLPEVGTVIEASDGREALAAIAEHRPTVVLMDIAMPELNGLEAAALGPSPFQYLIRLELDGVVHIATATWPDDQNPENRPNVALQFDPPLPNLETSG